MHMLKTCILDTLFCKIFLASRIVFRVKQLNSGTWPCTMTPSIDQTLHEAPVTKRRGIGPIQTEISPYKIRKKLFIFQIVRFNSICIWQNYFCILPNFGEFGAKTSLFRYLINQKRNNFIKHCPPPCINKPPISEMCIYMRHNLYKWGLDTRGGGNNVLQPKNGGRVSLQAKSRKYQGVFEVKSRVKTWQVRGIWSQQLEL